MSVYKFVESAYGFCRGGKLLSTSAIVVVGLKYIHFMLFVCTFVSMENAVPFSVIVVIGVEGAHESRLDTCLYPSRIACLSNTYIDNSTLSLTRLCLTLTEFPQNAFMAKSSFIVPKGKQKTLIEIIQILPHKCLAQLKS